MLDAIRSQNPYRMMQYEDLSNINNRTNKDIVTKKDITRSRAKRRKEINKLEDDVRESVKEKKKERVDNENLSKDDIRLIVVKGQKNNKNGYESIKGHGLIDDLSFLEIGDIV